MARVVTIPIGPLFLGGGCRGLIHVIKQGDTLYKLGKQYHVSVSSIMYANPYVNIYNLQIGDELCIPVAQPRPLPSGPMPLPAGARPVPISPAPQPAEMAPAQPAMGRPMPLQSETEPAMGRPLPMDQMEEHGGMGGQEMDAFREEEGEI